jgi:hypothetical protein
MTIEEGAPAPVEIEPEGGFFDEEAEPAADEDAG